MSADIRVSVKTTFPLSAELRSNSWASAQKSSGFKSLLSSVSRLRGNSILKDREASALVSALRTPSRRGAESYYRCAYSVGCFTGYRQFLLWSRDIFSPFSSPIWVSSMS